MRTGTLLLSAIHFFVVLIVLSVGAFFLSIPYAPHVRVLLIDALLGETQSIMLFGYAILLLGVLLLTGFYAMYRRPYLQLEMEPKVIGSEVTLELGLLRDYVEKYWKELFPENNLTTDIVIHANQEIELVAEMPDVPPLEHTVLLEKIEKELGELLAKNLGYNKDFLLTVVVKR